MFVHRIYLILRSTNTILPVDNIVLSTKMSSSKVLTLLLGFIYSDQLLGGSYDSNSASVLLDTATFANMYLLDRYVERFNASSSSSSFFSSTFFQ
jgi:hypothetical protein